MENLNLNGAANGAANNPYGFGLTSNVKPVAAPHDNEGACAELLKDMRRGDNLSIKFMKDKDNYPCVWVESKNVAGYKVRLNPTIFTWVMEYLENGTAEWDANTVAMDPTEDDSETFKTNMLKLFIESGKKIQWTPLFRERNGKLSGAHIAKYGKIYFYVSYCDELVDWLREMKQAI